MKKKTRKFFVSAIAFCMAVIISLPSVIVSLPSIVVEAADSPSICVEIECETLTDKASYVEVESGKAEASNGGYLIVKNGTSYTETTPSAGTYEVKANYTFGKDATVNIWIRAKAGAKNAAFYSSINGGEYKRVNCPAGKGKEFNWVQLSKETEVKEGTLTIDLHRRNDQVCFDKIIITDDLSFTPVNMDDVPNIDTSVAATEVSIDNGESVSVEVGKTATLTATVAPDNATDKTVTWSSGDEAVAPVDATTGVVTGVSAGTATITATVGENITDTITVNVTPTYVAQIEGGEKYETLQAAIEAATEGKTIKLLNNVAATADVTIASGVTLDLNGYTLDMGDNCLHSYYGNVVDNSGKDTTEDVSDDKRGRLKVGTYAANEVEPGKEALIGKPKGTLAPGNSQMPIYTDKGYMFADMFGQGNVTEATWDDFTVTFRPSFGKEHAAKLANGADAAKLEFIIRLDWIDDKDKDKKYYQLFKCKNDLVQTVYGQEKAFSVKFEGLTGYKAGMKVTVFVKSDLGVESLNNEYTMQITSNE